MPPMPLISGIPAPAGSGLSAITASVVKNIAATDAENLYKIMYYLYSRALTTSHDKATYQIIK